jgi:hypothetical protein
MRVCWPLYHIYAFEASMMTITLQIHFGCKHGDHYTRDALEPSMTTIIYTGGEHGGHYTTDTHWRRAWWPLHHNYTLDASMETITPETHWSQVWQPLHILEANMAAITQHISTGGEHGGHSTTDTHWRRALQSLHNRYPLEASMVTIAQKRPYICIEIAVYNKHERYLLLMNSVLNKIRTDCLLCI